jgi:uncharacterized protein (DUF1697 family)
VTHYVALLRGINVGGKNLIKMTALKGCFEKQGFSDVVTYIASGNVLFKADGFARDELTLHIEQALGAMFDYRASVVLRSRKQMQEIVRHAPKGFGAQPDQYRYDVIFLKEPLTSAAAMKSVLTKPGVDQAFAGSGALYFARLTSRATESQLSRVVSLSIYKSMTIRNWNTTTALLRMMEESD